MTDTDLITAPTESTEESGRGRAPRAGLSGMVLTELRALAGELGIKGTSGMRKGALIDAIKERQSGGSAPASAKQTGGQMTLGDAGTQDRAPKGAEPKRSEAKEFEAKESAPKADQPVATADTAKAGSVESSDDAVKAGNDQAGGDKSDSGKQDSGKNDSAKNGSAKNDGESRNDGGRQGQGEDNRNDNRSRQRNRNQNDRNQNDRNQNDGGGQSGNQQGGNQNNNRNNRDDDGDGDGSGRGRRGRRFRERRRGRDRDGAPSSNEPQVSDDDVLQPVAGILDVLDNYAFVRTSGYLAGPNDVYVSMNLVRKNGLRRGDAITGAVKVPRDGEQPNQRQKFNPLVRLDTVNGTDIETAKKRPEFNKLTPLYPNQRLRLETTPERLDTRVIDLIMPIGKGQRALIVSPPKAGKTTILQDIANAITTNNPECHLMVVLVDERPEEVTDMQRSVKGEVIASTFDRPPSDHTSVAELGIERAKRLVENGKDVVVLLDSITRLGRAYNNASPASGRILSGGVDSTALYPPKRFLGAARNIENGGSLTIIASALVETGSTGDTVIFEEFKGTGNAELKLDRKIADRRVFPAVDVNQSSTRKDELLMSPEEFAIMHKLRRVLSGLDSQQAIDLLISQLKKTRNNIEFLMQVQSNAPGALKDD